MATVAGWDHDVITQQWRGENAPRCSMDADGQDAMAAKLSSQMGSSLTNTNAPSRHDPVCQGRILELA